MKPTPTMYPLFLLFSNSISSLFLFLSICLSVCLFIACTILISFIDPLVYKHFFNQVRFSHSTIPHFLRQLKSSSTTYTLDDVKIRRLLLQH